MITKGSGFTLVEVLVVVAILGILAAVGTISYTGYVAGAKKKTAENAMQQIALAQTEYYSNNGEYHNDGDACKTTETTSNLIETKLFAGGELPKLITSYRDFALQIEQFCFVIIFAG